MTVSAQTPINSYTGNGVTTAFSFGFLVLLDTDIVVEVTDASGNVSTMGLGVDYTVSGVGVASGGTVTFVLAPLNGYKVVVYRATSLSRSVDYQENGDLPSRTLNGDLDRIWLALQELFGTGKGAANTLRVPAGESVNRLPALLARAGKFLGFDAGGQPLMLSGTGADAALRADLAASSGSALAGFTAGGLSSVARTAQNKMRDLVNIVDYGADPTGAADSSAAITAAWAAVKVAGTVKKGIYGQGTFRLSSAVTLAGLDNLSASTDAGSNVVIDIATLTPDAGIGVAITIHGLRRPRVRLSFVNGGDGTGNDVGVEWYDVENMEPHIQGSNFNGLLCKFDGNKGIWVENCAGTIWARKCYKAFDFSGVSTVSHNTGTGRITSVWDVLPTKGSVIQNMDDVTVDHYENTIISPTFTGTNSLSVSNCSSMHFGVVALGKDATNLMVVNGNTNIHIDNLYTFGGNTSGGGVSNGLLAYNNALFSIDEWTASGCARGFWCDGNNNLEVGIFQGLNNTSDIVMEKVSGSSFFVNLAFSRYFSQGAYAESIRAVAGGITGTLGIDGGRVRVGNVGGAATYAIDTGVSAGSLFTRCNDLEVDTSWGTSIRTVDKAKFAGYGNNLLGATPIIDATGRKGSLDGRTWLINVTAPSFATNVQNTNPYPVFIWLPLRFETTGIAGDFATLKLVDYEGTTHDLVDTRYLDAAPGVVIPFTLKGIVPAGWSYRIDSSSAAVRVTFSGTARSIRI